jgi:hypothetical protein
MVLSFSKVNLSTRPYTDTPSVFRMTPHKGGGAKLMGSTSSLLLVDAMISKIGASSFRTSVLYLRPIVPIHRPDFYAIFEPGFPCSALVVAVLSKALADLASLLLLRNPSPRIGFRIECVYNACLAILSRMDIARQAVLARQNPIGDSHPCTLLAIPSRELPLISERPRENDAAQLLS